MEIDIAKDREKAWENMKAKYHETNMNQSGYKAEKVKSVVKRRNFIGDLMKKNNVSSVLELGCNQGANLAYIQEKHPGIEKIAGIDINERAIKYGKEVEKNKADLQVSSIYDLSRFDDNSFDTVFTCTVLMHIPNEKIYDIISEMTRVAKNFVFHIECNGKSSVRGETKTVVNGKKVTIPHSFFYNFKDSYGKIGYAANVKSMEKYIGTFPVGGADHFIWVNLDKELEF